MKRRFTLFNDPEFLVGRKAICDYLGMSWRTVLRWKKYYGMGPLFMHNINGDPILIKSELRLWLVYYNDALKKRKNEMATKDGQGDDNFDVDIVQTSSEN